MVRSILLFLAGWLLMAPAYAQEVNDEGKASVTVVSPLSLIKIRDLEFGTIFLADGAAGGSVIIDPNQPEASEVTLTGDLIGGGDAHSAQFGGAPERTKKIKIRIPKGDITLTRIGGAETLIARDFTLEGDDQRTVPGSTYFDFRVGATLDVPAGTAEGVYEGDFEVQVQYP